MRIITTPEDIRISERTAVALGNFDGIHIGHRVILEDAVRTASEKGLASLCYTFSNHPFNYILNREPDDPAALKFICSEEQKIRMIEDIGFDILVNIPFDDYTMKMRAMTFIGDVLDKGLNADTVCVGFNYTFGARAEGRTDMLIREGEARGIDVHVHDAVTIEGDIVSSTLIRERISKGDMEAVRLYLGRPVVFDGVVEHGREIGRKISFPTVNLHAPADRAVPPNGVYFSNIIIDGDKSLHGVTNIGIRPTVGGDSKTIETHILGFEGDLYGHRISVSLEHFERPEMKMSGLEELQARIAEDVAACEKYFY